MIAAHVDLVDIGRVTDTAQDADSASVVADAFGGAQDLLAELAAMAEGAGAERAPPPSLLPAGREEALNDD